MDWWTYIWKAWASRFKRRAIRMSHPIGPFSFQRFSRSILNFKSFMNFMQIKTWCDIFLLEARTWSGRLFQLMIWEKMCEPIPGRLSINWDESYDWSGRLEAISRNGLYIKSIKSQLILIRNWQKPGKSNIDSLNIIFAGPHGRSSP